MIHLQGTTIMRCFVLNSESVPVGACLRRTATLLIVAVFVALFSGRAHAVELSVRIANGTDDAEEENSGAIDLTSSDGAPGRTFP